MRGDEHPVARVTNAVSTAGAYVAGVVLILLMLLTTADVAGRYFLNAPIAAVFDLTHFAVLVMVFLSLAYCGFQGAHVTIELLYGRLGPKGRALLDRLNNIAGSVLFLVIAWQALVQSVDVRDFGEASQLTAIPFWPFYWVLAFGAFLFAVVMAVRVFIPEPQGGDHP